VFTPPPCNGCSVIVGWPAARYAVGHLWCVDERISIESVPWTKRSTGAPI